MASCKFSLRFIFLVSSIVSNILASPIPDLPMTGNVRPSYTSNGMSNPLTTRDQLSDYDNDQQQGGEPTKKIGPLDDDRNVRIVGLGSDDLDHRVNEHSHRIKPILGDHYKHINNTRQYPQNEEEKKLALQTLQDEYQARWETFEQEINNPHSPEYNSILISQQGNYMVQYVRAIQRSKSEIPSGGNYETLDDKMLDRVQRRAALKTAFQEAIDQAFKYPELQKFIILLTTKYFKKWDAHTSILESSPYKLNVSSRSYSSILTSSSDTSENSRRSDEEIHEDSLRKEGDTTVKE